MNFGSTKRNLRTAVTSRAGMVVVLEGRAQARFAADRADPATYSARLGAPGKWGTWRQRPYFDWRVKMPSRPWPVASSRSFRQVMQRSRIMPVPRGTLPLILA